MMYQAALPWIAFGGLVGALLTMDLLVFHRRDHTPTLRESAGWCVFWIGLAFAFNVLVWWWKGHEAGAQFLSGYLIEESLSVDNLFVFAVIFRFFGVPLAYQYRVLFWGILGAVIMRLTFILAGTALIHQFAWMTSVFGVFLVWTAWKLARSNGSDEVDPQRNMLLRGARRLLPIASGDHGQRFFVREAGRLCITPLFLVLLVVESTDVLFAVDSVPAIFGISRDPFIIFSSNIFAILGLRAMYFLLAGVMDMFRYLHYGLSAVLGFVGLKMIGEYWLAQEGHHLISPWTSLAIVVSLLGMAITASLSANNRERKREVARTAMLVKVLEKQADKAIGEEPAWGSRRASTHERLVESPM